MAETKKTKTVPVEPTDEMYVAGKKALAEARELGIKSEAAWCYAAMVSAYKDVEVNK